MDRHRIAIVIPALNEEATIARVVSDVRQYGIPIVVDDGSNDATSTVAKDAGATVIRLCENAGYDGAINAGFSYAISMGCEYAITIDADGQHEPAVIIDFIHKLDDGADVVVGNRGKMQRAGEYLFSWIGSVLWGVSDPLCGLKAYRLDTTYKKLGHFDSYNSIGTELVIYTARNGGNIVQKQINIKKRLDKPRFGSGFSANRKIMRAIWSGLLRRGR